MSQEKVKKYKRAIATKVHINHLISGNYVKDELNNYIETSFGLQASRVRILGTVVRKWMPSANNETATERVPQASIIIDDCTETIRIKAWADDIKIFEEVEVGDLVDLIGHVREYEKEIYLTPEIIKKIEDPNWELVRELEIIEFIKGLNADVKIQPDSASTQHSPKSNLRTPVDLHNTKGIFKDQIVDLIKKLDETKGVSLSELKQQGNISEIDFQDIIKELINEGIIYQPSPGKYKIL